MALTRCPRRRLQLDVGFLSTLDIGKPTPFDLVSSASCVLRPRDGTWQVGGEEVQSGSKGA
jgi:hypothetical protein